jgi:hypothetical protein
MKLAWLSWYVTAVFALMCLASLVVTAAPQAQFKLGVIQAVSAAIAIIGIVTSMSLGWLPRDHWANESRKLRAVFITISVVATLMLVTCVG